MEGPPATEPGEFAQEIGGKDQPATLGSLLAEPWSLGAPP